jgi:uncharacterized RDD family membrane protein YckC
MTDDIAVSLRDSSPYGGFWLRLAAYLIDGLIITIPFGLLAFLWPDLVVVETSKIVAPEGQSTINFRVTLTRTGSIILAIAFWAYTAFLESSKFQATLGKRAVGLLVTNYRGERISLSVATVRSWPIWLPVLLNGTGVLGVIVWLAFLISCVSVAFTKQKQGLHDTIGGCLVVRRGARFAPAITTGEDAV